jgi:hypothetical protein
MDYFCYISRTKVDQFYQNLTPELVDEWTEKRMTENDVGLEGTADFNLAKLVNLFKGGITYGRKGVIQREQKVKSHYVEKLRPSSSDKSEPHNGTYQSLGRISGLE